MNNNCPKGFIMRSKYKTKKGTIVPEKCIKAQSNSGEKTSIKVKEFLKKKEKMYREANKKFPKAASKKCKKGFIKREGYKVTKNINNKKTEYWVEPKCIKSQVNRSTKGSKEIVILEKDVLKKYGYSDIVNKTFDERKKSLKKALLEIKPLSVYRRIIAISTLNKNKNPKLYKKLKEDIKWLKIILEKLSKKNLKFNKR